jgi:archaemetzincin
VKKVYPHASKGGRVRHAPSATRIVSRALILALLAVGSIQVRASSPPSVAIVPLGRVDRALLTEVAAHLRSRLGAQVTILPQRKIPDSAYYAPRNRYRGDGLLDFLALSSPMRFSQVIGITDKDISVTSGPTYDWGVMGVARLSARPGVVSTFRLKADSPSSTVLRARLDKVVLHELGHALGLPHCQTPHCLMHDAEGSIRTVDSSTGDLCPVCASRLAQILR